MFLVVYIAIIAIYILHIKLSERQKELQIYLYDILDKIVEKNMSDFDKGVDGDWRWEEYNSMVDSLDYVLALAKFWKPVNEIIDEKRLKL